VSPTDKNHLVPVQVPGGYQILVPELPSLGEEITKQ
jgi:hypothetical protein